MTVLNKSKVEFPFHQRLSVGHVSS